jgi:drug/metabolite transporter (DMT)-like permease
MRSERSHDSTTIVFFAGVNSAAAAAASALVVGEPLVIPLLHIAIGFALGIFVLAGGMIMFALSTSRIPAAEATLLCMTEVVLAPIWVWLLLDERMSLPSLAGGVILLSALFINAISGMMRSRPRRVPQRRSHAVREPGLRAEPARGRLEPQPAE